MVSNRVQVAGVSVPMQASPTLPVSVSAGFGADLAAVLPKPRREFVAIVGGNGGEGILIVSARVQMRAEHVHESGSWAL